MVFTFNDITVVIPAYNAEKTISRTLESCLSIGLNRIVVINDGSTDATQSIVRSKDVLCVTTINQGAAASRELGLSHVETDLVIFLDADDQLLEDGVRESLKLLDKNSDLGFVGAVGSFIAVASDNRPLQTFKPWATGVDTRQLVERGYSPGPPGCMLWSTSAVRDSIGLEIPKLNPRLAEDYEQLIRLSMVGNIVDHEKASCLYLEGMGKSASAGIEDLKAANQIRIHYSNSTDFRFKSWTYLNLLSINLRRLSITKYRDKRLFRISMNAASFIISPDYYAQRFWMRIERKISDAIYGTPNSLSRHDQN
jgi:glycosyltransferase involved in cell wall biosynthesis